MVGEKTMRPVGDLPRLGMWGSVLCFDTSCWLGGRKSVKVVIEGLKQM